MKWDTLTMSQKQALMKIYVNNGITNLDEIKNHYNSFDEGGPTKENSESDRSLLYGRPSYAETRSNNGKTRPTPAMITLPKIGAGVNIPVRLFDKSRKDTINNSNINTDNITRHSSYIGKPTRRINRFDDGGYVIQAINTENDFSKYSRAAINSLLKDIIPSGYERSIIATDPDGNPVRIYNLDGADLPEGYTRGHEEYETKLKEARKKLDYIGGDEKSRYLTFLSKSPKFTNKVDSLSRVYNINPDIMYERLGQEGLLDRDIELYNEYSTAEEQKGFIDSILDRPVNAFSHLGLDTAGELLNKGLLDMRWQDENLGYSNITATNEKEQPVQTVDVPNLESGLEIKAAVLEYITKMMKERYPNASDFEIDTLVNGAYNLGQYHKDLKDVDYIFTRYNVSPWSEYLMKEKYPDFEFKPLKMASLEEVVNKKEK